jgi:hypothetical protein
MNLRLLGEPRASSKETKIWEYRVSYAYTYLHEADGYIRRRMILWANRQISKGTKEIIILFNYLMYNFERQL